MAQLKPGKFCPLVQGDCKELQCNWFTQVRGKNPQTGAEIDEWGCAVTWLPVLLINTAQEVRQGAAATESFRNEMVAASQETVRTMENVARLALSPIAPALQARLIEQGNQG